MEHYTPSGRGPELISVFAAFLALTTVIVALRVYVRAKLVKNFGADDWTAVLGWLLFVFHASFAIAGAYHGTGQHANLIPPQELPIGLKWWWVCEPLYVVSNMAVKLSIALMLLRVFSVEPAYRLAIHLVTGVIQLYSVVFFFLFVFQCTPPSYFWTRFGNGQCMNPDITVTATYVYSGLTVICDWTMAILPWFAVRKLQMNLRTKIMVTGVLAMASIASMATIVRIPYISSMTNTADFLYSTVDVAIWSCCETGLSITASCAATLKPLVRKRFGTSVNLTAQWNRDGFARQTHHGSVRVGSVGDGDSAKEILKTSEVTVGRV